MAGVERTVEPADLSLARAMLQQAASAAKAFAGYDAGAVRRIVDAAAQAGAARAGEFGERAVAETGFGVAADKRLKNLTASTGLRDHYAADDFVTPTVDRDGKIVQFPRPAGVVLALTPSTNPVSTVFFKVMLCLMTRNAVVVCPHPRAQHVGADAARTLYDAARAAGAPEGCVQWVEEPSVALVSVLMADPATNLVVATGGNHLVRAAYRSGTPAIGVGPGNVPVLVDRTADLAAAARRIVASKSFDNSLLCTNESVLVVEDAAAGGLLRHLGREGAHLLDAEARNRVRDTLFPAGSFDPALVGLDAVTVAARAGLQVPPGTRVLIAPFDVPVAEEPLAHEKLCPVLGLLRVPTVARGVEAACALLRIGGIGHSAAIHSTDPAAILLYTAAVPVQRVSVNVGASLGGSGQETNLAPSNTIGTGFAGGSSLGENLQPAHLIQPARVAWNADAGEPMPALDIGRLWAPPGGRGAAVPSGDRPTVTPPVDGHASVTS